MTAKSLPASGVDAVYKFYFELPQRWHTSCDASLRLVDGDGKSHALRLKIATPMDAPRSTGKDDLFLKNAVVCVFKGCDVYPVGDRVGSVLRGVGSVLDGFVDIEAVACQSIHKRFRDVAKPPKPGCLVTTASAKDDELVSKRGTSFGRRAHHDRFLAG